MLELINVSKRFGELQALQPTTLNIEPGKTTALLGPSGCGKSTLLRIIVGLIQSDTGSFVFEKRHWGQAAHRGGGALGTGSRFRSLPSELASF